MSEGQAGSGRYGLRIIVVVAAKIAVAALLLWAVVRFGIVDLQQLAGLVNHPWILFISGLLVLAAVPVAAYRWQILLRALAIEQPLGALVKVVWLAVATGLVMPGTSSGEAIRVGYVALRLRPQFAVAMTSLLVDRIVATLGLLLVGLLLALPVYDRVLASAELLTLMAGLGVLFALGIVLFLTEPLERAVLDRLAPRREGRIIGFAHDVLSAVGTYRGTPWTLAIAILLSAGIHLSAIAAGVLIAVTLLGDALPAAGYAFAMPASLLANLAPITPGGLGVGEAAFNTLCQWLAGASGATTAFGTAFLAHRGVQMAALLVGAIFLRLPLLSRGANEFPGRHPAQ